jgi:hypothetical protein
MVKLQFTPKDTCVVSSVSSKKTSLTELSTQMLHLQPFKDFNENCIEPFTENLTQNETPFIPRTTKDIVGLENCHYIVNDWFTKSCKQKLKPLILIGPTGCGKTTLIEFYCQENNVNLYTIKATDTLKTKKELLKEIQVFSEFSFFKTNNPKLLFIDEYQNGQHDLLSIQDIMTLYEQSKIPILIISADSKGSKLSDLKKMCEVYYINEINLYYIQEWVNTLPLQHHQPEKIRECVLACKSDKRLLINTLLFFTQSSEISYKDNDINTFECISDLFENKELNFNELYKIYETDGFILSNLVHENYLEYNTDIDAVAKSADAISYGEIIFSDTYESNRTFLPEAHFVNSICVPGFYSRTDKPNKNIRTSCINNRYNIYLNNKKIISKISNNTSFDVFDIFTLKKFVNYSLIKTKVLSTVQEEFIMSILTSLNPEKLELVYKHFSEFKESKGKETKTKSFTLKFKEKIKALNGRIDSSKTSVRG